jgi:RimJ/RimL family protein N-acetyltransferase
MLTIVPTTLEGHGVRLEPMAASHADGLATALADGRLWELFFTAVPERDGVPAYIETALDGLRNGHMLPWVVRDLASGAVIGSTRYHDIVADIGRVEIGYTWYAESWQRTHVNTACKLLLMTHAFEVMGCAVVALRTDNFNFRSQQAILRLGAQFEGRLRRSYRRRDGSLGDRLFYSILAEEWAGVKQNLGLRLLRRRG